MTRSLAQKEASALTLSPNDLRQLLRYEPETGKLFWRERPPEMFATKRSGSIWNARYAKKEAFTAITTNGYRVGRIFDQSYKAHRVAWAIFYGKWPDHHIDHIDGDTSNNCQHNLRDVSRSQNMFNQKRRRDNSSGYKNVIWHKQSGKWCARIRAFGATHSLGMFADPVDAFAAAEKARSSLHGSFGRSS